MFNAVPVVRAMVERADAAWIHGRGNDGRARALFDRHVVVIGCGSLGSSTAARLARAGVGRIDLVDPERLAWSNVGRHELGADAVGSCKAEALAARIRRDLPHIEVIAHVSTAHRFMIDEEEVLDEADLVICATASWDAESAINWRHVRGGRRKPVLYGWLEDQALAAHALVVGSEGGCLGCGFGPTGVPKAPAVSWPGGRPVVEEPACGNHYQPYGAIELGAAIDLVARAALDALLTDAPSTMHAAWLAPAGDVDRAGAEWSVELREAVPDALMGGVRVALDWMAGCRCCREQRSEAA
jgi:molybdopterin/thiamine biosynthesis adenylyltransferase